MRADGTDATALYWGIEMEPHVHARGTFFADANVRQGTYYRARVRERVD